jgi:hypothetical protein
MDDSEDLTCGSSAAFAVTWGCCAVFVELKTVRGAVTGNGAASTVEA